MGLNYFKDGRIIIAPSQLFCEKASSRASFNGYDISFLRVAKRELSKMQHPLSINIRIDARDRFQVI